MPDLPKLPSKPVNPNPPSGGGKPKPPGGGGKPKPPKWPEFVNDPNAPAGPTPEGPPNIPGADTKPEPPVTPDDGEKPVVPTGDDTGDEKDPYEEYFKQQEAQRQRNAIAAVRAMLDQYGLSSLYNVIVGYVQEGYDAETVMTLIRTTPEYKQRFPAMEALAKKGRAISEAVYIDYERGAASLEQRYGLPKGMLMGNVTKLLEGEVSTSELNDRVALASSASLQAPQDLRDTLSNYYGIGQGGLTAYFLDPGVAMPLLEKQYATAQIGTEALRQDVGIDVGVASQLQELGVTQQQAQAGFGEVSRQREFMSGRGETATQRTLIMGNVAGEQAARQQIERIGAGRVGRFQGGGGFIGGQQGGRSGLQESTT